MTEDTQDLVKRPTISVDAASRILCISRGAAYAAVKSGEFQSNRCRQAPAGAQCAAEAWAC